MSAAASVHGPALLGLGLALVVAGVLPATPGGDPGPIAAAAATPDSRPDAEPSGSAAREPTAASSPGPATEPSETAVAEHQDIVDFYAGFNTAVAASDAAALYELLHPLVSDRYGTDQCRSYLEEFSDEPFEVEVLGSEPPASWVWVLDGERTAVDPAIEVRLRLSVGEASVEQEAHVAVADGELRWFTDCGDPAT